MNHFTSPSFWKEYEKLPKHIKELADKNFEILKENLMHPSLHFKKVGNYRSVRVGEKHLDRMNFNLDCSDILLKIIKKWTA